MKYKKWSEVEPEYGPLSNRSIAEDLYEKGYRQTSRKYGIISRVDIPDEELTKSFIKINHGCDKTGIGGLSLESKKDFYRRVYSNDSIEGVPEEILKTIRYIERKELYGENSILNLK